MLTLKYLLSKSLPLHRDTAPDVAIRGVKARKRRSNGNPAIVAKVQSKGYVRGTSPPKKHPIYEAIIEGMMGEGSKVSDKYVSVSCSCEYFLYNCEYALAKQGASQIRYSNGQPPVVRNPQEKPILCKHLTRLAQEVIAKGW